MSKSESQDRNVEQILEENKVLRKKVGELDEAMQCVADSASSLEQVKAEKDQLEQKAKAPLIRSLVKDSKGFFNESDLDKLPHDALTALRDSFDGEVARVFMDWLDNRRQRDEARKQKWGTVGSYDQEKGTYEGGVVV